MHGKNVENFWFSKTNTLPRIGLASCIVVFAVLGVKLFFFSHAATSSLVGDLNNDNTVNVFDLSIFLAHWQEAGSGLPEDFNNDGTVNIFDLSMLLNNWGKTGATISAAWASPDWTLTGQPGNWSTTPIPANVVLNTSAAPYGGSTLNVQAVKELAGQAAALSWVNTNAYSERTYYVPLNTPLQPVRLCRSTSNCVPNWGPPTDDLWRAAMGENNTATPNRTTGAPAVDDYIGGGIPLTADVEPAPGTDAEAVICLGGGHSGDNPWVLHNSDGSIFKRPDGQEIEGNCWEIWGLRADPNYDSTKPVSTTNTKWEIAWGAHRTGFFTQAGSLPNNTYGLQLDTLSGRYCPRVGAGEYICSGISYATQKTWFGPAVGYPGSPDATTYEAGWGVTAAETPLLTDVVQQHDCQNVLSGALDFGHAIGVQLKYSRYLGSGSTAWWPAGSSDGNNSHMAIGEGMRFFFGPSVQMPAGLSAPAQAMFRTMQKYGIIIDDQTGGGTSIVYNADGSYASGGTINIRTEIKGATDECGQLGITSALKGIPWSQLSGPIKQGSDTNPNPTQ